jgi:menaquinone-dependent protoporphyrinogen oxidase
LRVLGVYGSSFGQAEAVLRRVAGALEARGHTVEVFKGDALPADLVVDDFDAVVVAASIIIGKYQPYIRQFVRRHAAGLRGRPTAFISVNGSSPESMPEWRAAATRYVDTFLKDTGWQPGWTATFSGALRYPRYGIVTRWIMKMISRRTGGPTDTSQEYEFTDWNAVDQFARDLAAGLGHGGGQPVPGPGATGNGEP